MWPKCFSRNGITFYARARRVGVCTYIYRECEFVLAPYYRAIAAHNTICWIVYVVCGVCIQSIFAFVFQYAVRPCVLLYVMWSIPRTICQFNETTPPNDARLFSGLSAGLFGVPRMLASACEPREHARVNNHFEHAIYTRLRHATYIWYIL